LDGGNSRSEYCAAYTGGDATSEYQNSLDGGDAGTNVCANAVCAAILEGGDAMAAYCHTYDGGGILTYDAGSANTNLCAV